MQFSKTVSAGIIQFYVKVSSQTYYDYFIFYIDGVVKVSLSGTVGWTQKTYEVTAGNRIFKWEYSKDYSVNAGSDTVWIDNIVIGPCHSDCVSGKCIESENSAKCT